MNIGHLNERLHRILVGLPAIILVMTFWGCLGGGNTTPLPFQYSLEYSSPVLKDLAPLEAVLKVERFASDQTIKSISMIYQPQPYQYDAFYYHYWRARPQDLITDFFIRDLRNSGLFRAVFSYHDGRDCRFVLQGTVTECFAQYDEQKKDQRANLSLNLTLLDMEEKEVTQQIVLQKRYDFSQGMEKRTPDALARGISMAMEDLSGKMIREVHRAVQARIGGSAS